MLNPFEMDYEKMQHGIVTPGVFKKSEITPDSKVSMLIWYPNSYGSFQGQGYTSSSMK